MIERTARGDAGYEARRRAMVWPSNVPDRYPAAIVAVTSREEARAVLTAARRDRRRVSVRSGGHSYIGSSLRDESVLLDLGRIAHAHVDVERRVARVGPGVGNGELDRLLETRGLAFPVGHSPSVAVGGYLLGGGLGWNPDGWGIAACGRVIGATVLLADGEVVTVSADSHPDLFFALRGGGPYFPGIVLEYELDLVPRPRRITELSCRVPAEDLAALVAWAQVVLDIASRAVEASITLTRDPGRVVATATAVAFADDSDAAAALLAPFAGPLPASAITRHRCLAEMLADNDDPPARYAVEGFWAHRPADVLGSCVEAVRAAPAGDPLVHVSLRRDAFVPDGMAFSVAAPVFVFASMSWADPAEDAPPLAWQDALIESAGPARVGHYVNECDYRRRPERLAACFSAAAADRLRSVLDRYDPDRMIGGGQV